MKSKNGGLLRMPALKGFRTLLDAYLRNGGYKDSNRWRGHH